MPTLRNSAFLDVPREVRDIIYQHCVQEKDGYSFDFGSGKLRASRQPIDLALMYTCKTVAAEIRGLPLGTNTITFSTIYSESLRLRAGRFHKAMVKFANAKWWMLAVITRPLAAPLRTPELIAEILQKFPQFERDLISAIQDVAPYALKNRVGSKNGKQPRHTEHLSTML